MTENDVERMIRRPNPWITLIPLWIIGSAVMAVVGLVSVLITATASDTYHMTWYGEPVLLAAGEHAQPPAARR
jgi:hypothetical protein